jgi:two-component system, NtrC family, sensor kinase
MTLPLIIACTASLVAGPLLVLLGVRGRERDQLLAQIARLKRQRRRRASSYLARRVAARSAYDRYWARLYEFAAPVLVTRPDGRIVAANAAQVAMLGYDDESELQRLTASQLYANPATRAGIAAMLKSRGGLYNEEVKLRRRDGVEIDVLVTIRVVEMGGEAFYEGVNTDISELRQAAALARKLEAQLHLAQKLEAVGQLASGIAHEINTPIQFIGDNVHFLRGTFGKIASAWQAIQHAVRAHGASGDFAGLAGEIERIERETQIASLVPDATDAFAESIEGLESVTETVRAMKEFAHPGDGEVCAVDINHSIATTLVVARNEYKHVADIVTDYGDLPMVDCRPGAINKVFLNIIVNAAHAIERKRADGGGRGVISVRTTHAPGSVAVTISDTGCGIPRALINKIFDPFFTTKPVGKGTGQGLAIARSIVKSHGGDIDVESTPNVGTTFRIQLPLADHATDAEDPIGGDANAIAEPTERAST